MIQASAIGFSPISFAIAARRSERAEAALPTKLFRSRAVGLAGHPHSITICRRGTSSPMPVSPGLYRCSLSKNEMSAARPRGNARLLIHADRFQRDSQL